MITTAPKTKSKPKPSQQTQFIMDAMAEASHRAQEKAREEEDRWAKMQESLDLLYAQVHAMDATQSQLVAQMEITAKAVNRSTQDQILLAKHLAETSEAVARISTGKKQMGEGVSNGSVGGHDLGQPSSGQRPMFGHHREKDEQVTFPRPALPKLSFPKFNGENPKIWLDKCRDYFSIFNIPECMWTTAASLHMEDNAAKWLQVYKLKQGLGDWSTFVTAVEQKFGAYDYRRALSDMLALRQEGTVEDYTREFESAQFAVSMHNVGYDDMFFVSHYINGLKEEIKGPVESQVPDSVDRASHLARIQQRLLTTSKLKHIRYSSSKTITPVVKQDITSSNGQSPLWKERQLRDFRKANGLCFFCGDKFEPGHLQKCVKRTKPQLNAIVVNDLDVELTEDTLNKLEIEDVLAAEMCQLSLNAIAGTDSGDAMKIRALVNNKVMLILVDSGSSHNFVSKSFLQLTGVTATKAQPMMVKVANGDNMITDSIVPQMTWWA